MAEMQQKVEEMEAKIKELDQKWEQWGQAHREVQDRVLMTEENMKHCGREMTELKNKMNEPREERKKNLTNGKGFMSLGVYNGVAEDYDDWSFKVRMYVQEQFHEFGGLVKKLEAMNDEVEDNAIQNTCIELGIPRSAFQELDEQLYLVLAQKTGLHVLTTVKNLKDEKENRGIVAWHRIQRAAIGKNKIRVHELARKIMSPNRLKSYNEVSEALEKWEMMVREFEMSSDQPLPEAIKQGAVKAMVPSEMEADINRQSNDLTDFKKVREYISSQAAQRREPYFEPQTQTQIRAPLVANTEETQEDEAFAFQGEFPGYCHCCNAWGHRINQCPQKDAQMKGKGDSKGKGKDSGFKGYSKGHKGGYSGFGYGGQKGGYQNFDSKGKSKGKGTFTPYGKGVGYGGYGKGGYQQQAFMMDWGESAGDYAIAMNIEPVTKNRPVKTWNTFDPLSCKDEEDEVPLVDDGEWPKMAEETFRTKPKKMTRWHQGPTQKQRKETKNQDGVPESILKGVWQEEDEFVMYLDECENHDPALNVTRSELVWVKVQSIMDTGCGKSVAPPSLACHLPLIETEESRRGAEFQTAGGGKLANQGDRVIPCWTNVGQAVEMKYSVADVVRPLNAVSQICDRGNEVTFTSEGGYIWNKNSNNVVEFPRERGVYVLDTWMQMPREAVKESGFTWQER